MLGSFAYSKTESSYSDITLNVFSAYLLRCCTRRFLAHFVFVDELLGPEELLLGAEPVQRVGNPRKVAEPAVEVGLVPQGTVHVESRHLCFFQSVG